MNIYLVEVIFPATNKIIVQAPDAAAARVKAFHIFLNLYRQPTEIPLAGDIALATLAIPAVAGKKPHQSPYRHPPLPLS